MMSDRYMALWEYLFGWADCTQQDTRSTESLCGGETSDWRWRSFIADAQIHTEPSPFEALTAVQFPPSQNRLSPKSNHWWLSWAGFTISDADSAMNRIEAVPTFHTTSNKNQRGMSLGRRHISTFSGVTPGSAILLKAQRCPHFHSHSAR